MQPTVETKMYFNFVKYRNEMRWIHLPPFFYITVTNVVKGRKSSTSKPDVFTIIAFCKTNFYTVAWRYVIERRSKLDKTNL